MKRIAIAAFAACLAFTVAHAQTESPTPTATPAPTPAATGAPSRAGGDALGQGGARAVQGGCEGPRSERRRAQSGGRRLLRQGAARYRRGKEVPRRRQGQRPRRQGPQGLREDLQGRRGAVDGQSARVRNVSGPNWCDVARVHANTVNVAAGLSIRTDTHVGHRAPIPAAKDMPRLRSRAARPSTTKRGALPPTMALTANFGKPPYAVAAFCSSQP